MPLFCTGFVLGTTFSSHITIEPNPSHSNSCWFSSAICQQSISGSTTRLSCSANVHCQAGTCSLLAHRPVSTLSPNVQRFKFCLSVLLCRGTWWNPVEHICPCPLCVHSANSTCVSQIAPLSCLRECKYHRYSSDICVSTLHLPQFLFDVRMRI